LSTLPDFYLLSAVSRYKEACGTSSNGAGAFGGSINFSSNEVNKNAFLEVDNSFGSFNSWKNTIKLGTGFCTKDLPVSCGFPASAAMALSTGIQQAPFVYFTTAYGR
jgi:iron complex outermembrane receptor protein